ncbi:MAG: acyl carrier protein [Planctomycetes bacterium]|nr:acyl carrier protein [Planctomycetota bacterium]
MDEQEIFGKLIPLIREVTGARPHQIKMETFLMADLGAESIDLLDLSFLIEEAFDVVLEADEFESGATEQMGGMPYEQGGYLTPEALVELKKALPEVPPDKFHPGLKKIEVPGVMNVAVFVHLIQRKLVMKVEEVKRAEK